MEREIRDFVRYLKVERGATGHTLRNYQSDLNQFLKFMTAPAEAEGSIPARRVLGLEEIDHLGIRSYLADLHRRGLKKSSLARKLAVLRSFFKYLRREGLQKGNPARLVSMPRQERPLPAFLTVDEAAALMESPTGDDRFILRDRAILETFYSTGIRLSELVGLNREDIDFDNPDFDKFPALKQAKGYVTELKHGEMLYMPEGYCHYMKYLTPGFSMSLRAFPSSIVKLSKAAYNVFIMRHIDNFMKKEKVRNGLITKMKKH